LIRIATLSRPIENVNLVALLEKQRDPAASAIDGTEPVGTLSESAMDQDNGIGMANLAWDPALDIHLHAVADRPASQQGVLDAIPVVGPLGDIEDGRSRGLRLCGQCSGRQRSKFTASHQVILPVWAGQDYPIVRCTRQLPGRILRSGRNDIVKFITCAF